MYPLQTLFEIRERAKKDSEEAYAKEKQKLNEAEKKLKEMQEELKKMKAFREQKRAEYFEAMNSLLLKIEKIKINQRHLDGLLEKEEAFLLEIRKQEQVVEGAKERVQKALDIMMKATEEYKVLEKHKEKWALKQKKEREQKEESESDDITQARYNIQHKES
ncbi:MAG: hypothetical protein WCK42_07850 [Myxococcaceae bacterium]